MEQFRYRLTPRTQRRSQKQNIFDDAKVGKNMITSKHFALFFVVYAIFVSDYGSPRYSIIRRTALGLKYLALLF